MAGNKTILEDYQIKDYQEVFQDSQIFSIGNLMDGIFYD